MEKMGFRAENVFRIMNMQLWSLRCWCSMNVENCDRKMPSSRNYNFFFSFINSSLNFYREFHENRKQMTSFNNIVFKIKNEIFIAVNAFTKVTHK